ncbi:MAG: hypothetical protein RJB13_1733 [Pseudomonadota bacterium]|jgi:riboflavin kinase/FMN adenylyltransferase
MGDSGLRIFGDIDSVQQRRNVALTIGNFDGVHLGHLHVIETLRSQSGGLPLVVLTFDPHPSVLLSSKQAKQPLQSLNSRVEMLLQNGIDAVVVQDFSEEFSRLSADQFICDYLLPKFSIKCAVLGFDFCYGARRSGDWSHFETHAHRYGFQALRATPFLIDGQPVSSSRIRTAILEHDFENVERLLGRPFTLEGVVVKGDQRGRLIGFPTANLGLDPGVGTVLPFGVYAVEVFLPGENLPRIGVMNCGVRPTFAEGLKLQIETHIIGFSGDIYGCSVSFSVKKFIRPEMKFAGIDDLKSRIAIDVQLARSFFGV